jgi:hypothetical protein
MTAQTQQLFSGKGVIGSCKLQAANTATDGTGTLDAAGNATSTTGHLGTLFEADATNGGRVERIRCMAEGTNVATVLRIFVNNGSTNATATNNRLIAEVALPATTGSSSAVINSLIIELPVPQHMLTSTSDATAFPIVLGPGEKLMACLGTAVASWWDITAFGGSYAAAP